MGKVYLHSHLSPDDWEIKAGGLSCLVCDSSKQVDSICCTTCWVHLDENRQTAIINLLRQGRVGWALRKMCAWVGRASMPTRRNVKAKTERLFKELNYA